MQAPSQYPRLPGHTQFPALQCAPPMQTTPQAPQFRSSAVRSAHERLPQNEKPRGQQTPPPAAGELGGGPPPNESLQMPSAQTNGTAIDAAVGLAGIVGGGAGKQSLPGAAYGFPPSPSPKPV